MTDHHTPFTPATPALLPAMRGIAFGGDYNPEQWPHEVWDADYQAFNAANITTGTLGVFIWSLIQPSEETYDFSMLD